MYDNPNFFPIDDVDGKITGCGNEGFNHNFGFCMTVNNQFTYKKGQIFNFKGDDDVWVFVNKKLAIDLGGPHPPREATVEIDALGLTEGETYDFDLFYCERHREGSTLRFMTSIELSPCGVVDSDSDNIGDLCDNCPNGDPNVKVTSKISGLSASINIDFEGTIRDGVDVTVDWGNGKTNNIYTAVSTYLTHTYASVGTYKISVTTAAISGCAASSDEVEVNLNSRIAPKCSALPVFSETRKR